ncbi:MAG TPA: glycosyltransferase [Longimicrobiales bacterium]|nr:glycosyltransferase [Longimicrobiales bacterium]
MIYICIPTHNEQQTVGVVLWKIRQVFADFPRDYQLLVADDGSTDKTPEVLEPYTRVLPLTVIRSETRQGSAASLEMLLREAVRRSEYPKRDAIVTLQADFSEEPDDLVPLVKRLEAGADVAVGNKVSTSKDTRARKFARSLAKFFMRRQKWPEGVMTPFEGFRAYRLYAVKRAIEERGAARLVRHDGWAGHAELLRAVQPHARRVDVVDVDDRPDRLQRPRREKPFGSAMQVRMMASGAEPPGLVGVEELDRIALTASRSRERAAITPQSIQARGAPSRTNGSRTRQSGGSRRDQNGRARAQGNGAGRSRAEAGETRPRRERPAQAEGRTKQKSDEGRDQARSRQPEGRRRQPRDPVAAAAPEEQDVRAEQAAEGAVSPDAAAPPKRKRRRRKRGGQGRSGGAQDQNAAQDGLPESGSNGEPAGVQGSGSEARAGSTEGATEGDSTGPEGESSTGPKKRRRRGGRRGGRGRRKPRPEGGVDGEGTGDAGTGGNDGESPDASDRAATERPSAGAADRQRAESGSASERSTPEPVARAEND